MQDYINENRIETLDAQIHFSTRADAMQVIERDIMDGETADYDLDQVQEKCVEVAGYYNGDIYYQLIENDFYEVLEDCAK
ncbi:hypothetical protein CPHO_06970 [Corynebacterium phocae]|uniref:Uncharacterized protein n=1 Tax=Corynebacterium phocae TaxID=161895 RepID=A0A1L7D3D2_9CORY|nr:hypothetical protein [Corynebacterium phocae]APT92676.1 hypothetical protein CPHO_06970 [Corynebacterium phocae]KAA8723565.1 hypothetical protein F4V58_06485 [Corynebacterium phocae]